MKNRKKTAELLAEVIKSGLIDQYGKVPSAAFIADNFNLRAYGTSTISRETARKWLSGTAVPEVDKLIVLVKWLNISMDEVFSEINQTTPKIKGNGNGGSLIDRHLNVCLADLDNKSKDVVYLLIFMLKQMKLNDCGAMDCEKLLKHGLENCASCSKYIETYKND